ncbi:CAP domain-containing protein [Catellatospora vulcania]|uniref:CAP domain-containing protein n=1 Tax=Catellatospora vulcania TaxID=1460450 RepID=UPI001E4747E2|nr:CAP domain-containing protein [Catellatospora vulcania]
MALRGRYPGRHRASLQWLPALAGSGALVAVLLGGVLALNRPAATSAAPGDPPAAGAAYVTGTGDSPVSLSGDTASSRITPTASRPAAPRTAATTGRTSPESDRITVLEGQVATLINRERERAGCRRLRSDPRMGAAARRHSADMARNDYFSHTGRNGSSFVDRLEDAGYPRRHAAGENIAYGYSTANAVVDAWMGSTGHRSNIMNCAARASGVGLAYQGRTAYWTQEFGRE